MVNAKSFFVGILLLVIGTFPLLLKIKSISDVFAPYTFLTYFQPGEIIYQLILVILGILLLWNPKPHYYPRR